MVKFSIKGMGVPLGLPPVADFDIVLGFPGAGAKRLLFI